MGLLVDELDAAMVTVIDGSLASPRCFLALREQGCVIGSWSEAFVEPERDLHAHPATVHVRGELEDHRWPRRAVARGRGSVSIGYGKADAKEKHDWSSCA